MKKRVKITLIFLAMCVAALSLNGCGTNQETQKLGKEKITIAYQYGLGYAPAVVMKEKKYLEDKLPGVEVEWKVMNSGATINEGVAAGEIDVAMMGVAPFVIGWDKGIPYKVYSAMSCQPMGLMCNDPEIRSLKDFTEEDKIAVVSYGSIQHIILCMGAEQELGDMHALDNRMITMAHPEGYMALLTQKEVKAHFATMPYYSMELEEGMHEVMSTDEAFMKGSTLLIGLASNDFAENYPDMYQALVDATNEARGFIENNQEETAEILAAAEGIEAEQMLTYLQTEGVSYPENTKGILALANFMEKSGFTSKVPAGIEDFVFDNLVHTDSN